MRDPLETITLLMYLIAAISGGMGGAAAAGYQVLRDGRLRLLTALAYLVVGAVLGVLVLAYGWMVGVEPYTWGDLIGHSMVAGLIGSASLAGSSIGAQMVLRKLGWEVEINVHRRERDGDGRYG
ncbi:MAG: hypothetical protein ACLFRB_06815 [Thiohalorhabdus sp.]|uniref:hypothetical protein n=1 Tax=Thiohalorhabdus sp. TaxID=3094134 RepID=UPI003980A668